MRLFHRTATLTALVALTLTPALNTGCGEPPPPRAANAGATTEPSGGKTAAVAGGAPEAEPPMRELRTGAIAPVDHPTPIAAQAAAKQTAGEAEILALDVRLEGGGFPADSYMYEPIAAAIDGAGVGAKPFAFVERRSGPNGVRVWVRRTKSEAGKPIRGDLYTPSTGSRRAAEPGHHFRFEALDTASAPTDPKLGDDWAQALSSRFREQRGGGPWYSFAAERALGLAPSAKKKDGAGAGGLRPTPPSRGGGDDFARLMETTTGMASIQEALQHDRGLFITAGREKPSVPIEKLSPPKLAAHPFKEMQTALRAPTPAEPMASAAPAEFYYIRFNDLPTFFRVVDELDAWGTPLAAALDGRSDDRGLSERYEAALGLSRGPLSRSLGPEAIASVAVVGSDPYVREGTDVTVIFKVKSKALFEAGMATALGAHSARHGEIKVEKISYGGVSMTSARSPDGAVNQHRASSGDLEFVSNSKAALAVVMDAATGKRPRLADEPDFRYMLARDAKTRADVLGFMSDRFVAEVVGPRQKILEARRQIALAELSTPGYAALLYGWLEGESAASVDDLIKADLLSKDELRHGGGEAITYRVGEAARSSFGTPASLTPLIDLPSPTLVTASEQAGYERFVQGYQSYWSTYIDPAMLRVAVDATSAGLNLTADLRIMPLIDGSDYRDIQREVGSMRVAAPPIAGGARAVLGVAEDGEIRRDLGRFIGRELPGRHKIAIDWLGDWAMIGAADRPSLVPAMELLEPMAPERPMTEAEAEAKHSRRGVDDEIATIAAAPLYAAIGLKSLAGAALMVTAARAIVDEAAPGLVTWGEAETYKGVPIVAISVRDDGGERRSTPSVNIYYAFCKSALILSLKLDIIRGLIDDRLDGKSPNSTATAGTDEPGAPQLVIDIAPKERGAIWTLLTWALESEALDGAERSRATAEALFRGAPEIAGNPAAARALAAALFGAAPVTPDGASYSPAPEGPRDPARGTTYAPMWPAVPVAGSPVERATAKLSRIRAEMAFDKEVKLRGESAPMQSLHVRFTIAK